MHSGLTRFSEKIDDAAANGLLGVEGSLAHLADMGFDRVKKYAKSKYLADKLIGFNLLVFILVCICTYFSKDVNNFSGYFF